MKRLVLPAVVAVLAAAAPLPARAAADSGYRGGCGYAAEPRNAVVHLADGTDVWTGVLYSATLVYSDGTPADNPVAATVTCTIRVNGVSQATATFAGTVVVAGAKRASFRAWDDAVELCETVDYTSNATPSHTQCETPTMSEIPPQPIHDLVDAVIADADGLIYFLQLEQVICPLLAALAPGVPGVVETNDQGDVFLLGGLFYDCPPFDVTFTGWEVPLRPECSDGIDNDLDGFVDYPADPDCWGPESDAEGLQVPPAIAAR